MDPGRSTGLAPREAPAASRGSRLLLPLARLLERLARRLARPERVPALPDEAVAAGRREEVGSEAPGRGIIAGAFVLDATRAWSVMTPRVDVFAWPATRTLAEIARELPTVRYSRVPVYGDTIDDIQGILYTRDAYQALLSGQRDVPLAELAREPFYVPGSISLTRLLGDFQTRRIHLGIVMDEYGGTDGLVTLEDVLEELVGEIADERDLDRQSIVRVSRNEILVEGAADLREVNHFFNTTFPRLEHRSLNGYLLAELGRVPDTGEEMEREGVRITIVEASETQVLSARLLRPHAAEDGRDAPGA